MKKFVSVILLIAVIIALAACGSNKEIAYKNDVAVSAISEATNAALENGSEMVIVPETYVNSIMKVDTANFTEFTVCKQATGAVIDEYGIFKVKDVNCIDATLAAINDYIEVTKNSSMIVEYMPEEMPKLDTAEARAMGEYVVFCILSEEGKAQLFSTVSKMIAE